jgi:N-acetylglucosaminyldiphosphoundecaprenol N-acetyl-beta-D-mannosaminyltransferase
MRAETRVNILSTPLDALSFAETVERARTSIVTRNSTQQVSMNVAKLVKMRTDAVLREDVLSSDIISADGVGIVWACKFLGLSGVQRVAGVDLMFAILELCAKEGYRPYFLGAHPEVLNRAIRSAQARWPGLKVAGAHHGYFKKQEEESVLNDILSAHPDCLFIAMPTPRKERFLAQHRTYLKVPYIMGVGGSLDIVAGKVTRAPLWMRRAGLEWLYRVLQEPRRMWWRYTTTNAAFAVLIAAALMRSVRAKLRKQHAHQN